MPALLVLLALTACADPPEGGDAGETPTPPADAQVVTLRTQDGVSLEADWYAGTAGAPGVVLLHMNPSGPFTRADWPPAFVSALRDAGFAVLVPDRRGAGGSDGVAAEAYEGPGGRLDVAAAVAHLTDAGHARLGLVGASNGTTAMVDYAVAPTGAAPAALVYFTGGTYTENQTPAASLPTLPSLFLYSDLEDDWSEAQRGRHDDVWRFHEIAGAGHGTRMFDGPESAEASRTLVGFLEGILDPS